ncbi:CAP domain-containing protein [Taklimakanibacter lacteus]|uniref:CAP domain-containing protein n=1 Tax=Taklimakanibacter lacteus TaxID=2268456 RepID=UPI0034D61442
MTLIRFVSALFLAAFLGLSAGMLPAGAAGNYAQYARALLQKLPENSGARPDLEAYLDKLVSSYRQANGREGLAASDMMREAARAQAADMMFAGKSGHKSRAGHSFDQRFGAFVEPTLIYKARGENAASDRKKGPADRMKAKALFDLWLDSSGHRRNLMKRDYEFVSTGVIQRGDELWAVQIFWSKPVPADSNPLVIGIGG